MKNINLNPGGIIGAVVGAVIAGVVLFAVLDANERVRRTTKLVVIALVGGAFAGNYIWGAIFKKSE